MRLYVCPLQWNTLDQWLRLFPSDTESQEDEGEEGDDPEIKISDIPAATKWYKMPQLHWKILTMNCSCWWVCPLHNFVLQRHWSRLKVTRFSTKIPQVGSKDAVAQANYCVRSLFAAGKQHHCRPPKSLRVTFGASSTADVQVLTLSQVFSTSGVCVTVLEPSGFNLATSSIAGRPVPKLQFSSWVWPNGPLVTRLGFRWRNFSSFPWTLFNLKMHNWLHWPHRTCPSCGKMSGPGAKVHVSLVSRGAS